jgi:hypothetical protein
MLLSPIGFPQKAVLVVNLIIKCSFEVAWTCHDWWVVGNFLGNKTKIQDPVDPIQMSPSKGLKLKVTQEVDLLVSSRSCGIV